MIGIILADLDQDPYSFQPNVKLHVNFTSFPKISMYCPKHRTENCDKDTYDNDVKDKQYKWHGCESK
jgi:hypothetical protein